MIEIEQGQIWRDTSNDKAKDAFHSRLTHRTVRVVAESPDAEGKWLVEAVTSWNGDPAKPRRTRISPKTFAAQFTLAG